MVEKIGIDAGKVWTKLEEEGRMNVRSLRNAIKLTERDTFAAIGWLAKEGKLTLEKDGRDFYVELS
ncbi:MAG TPA: winged helix-turn-helix domain-containing protein [Bacteroidales bacterium]|nr:winged helix-turn-helix domain-containing protein [Bacteroidales bacterium]